MVLFSKDLGGVSSQVIQENAVVKEAQSTQRRWWQRKPRALGQGLPVWPEGHRSRWRPSQEPSQTCSHADRGAGGAGTSGTREGLHLQSWCVEAGRLGRDQRDSRLSEAVEPTGTYRGGAVVTMVRQVTVQCHPCWA